MHEPLYVRRTTSLDATLVEGEGRKYLDAGLYCRRSRSGFDWNCAVSHSRMESILVDALICQYGRVRDNNRLSPGSRSPIRETPSRRRAAAHLRGSFQRIRISGHVDRESS